MGAMTLCWDCEHAIGGCSWSNKLKPVEGWRAIESRPSSTRPYSTYFVVECPMFKRDAYDGGIRRKPREEIKL